MTKREDLDRMSRIGELILDQRLATLREAAKARARSLEMLAVLSPAPQDGCQTIAEAQALLLYQRWADARRADINLTLARQTAQWLEARAAAAQAFGRADVLRQLQNRAPE